MVARSAALAATLVSLCVSTACGEEDKTDRAALAHIVEVLTEARAAIEPTSAERRQPAVHACARDGVERRGAVARLHFDLRDAEVAAAIDRVRSAWFRAHPEFEQVAFSLSDDGGALLVRDGKNLFAVSHWDDDGGLLVDGWTTECSRPGHRPEV